MRRALRRGGWALSITAGLTLTAAAAAQPPGQAPAAVAGKPPPAQTAARPVAEDPSRVREIAVELGWLADPLTFPYQLGARVTGQTLEIRGYVPSLAVRERAAKVARANCPLAVIDRLTLRPEVAVKTTSVPVEKLYTAAVATIRGAFPVQATMIRVEARAYGQVLLSGNVASFEEKLAVSACLRRLPGCTGVVNNLKVGSPSPPVATAPGTAPNPSRPSLPSGAQAATQPVAVAQPQATPLATPLSLPSPALPAPQQNSAPAANASPYASEPAMPGTTMPRWTTAAQPQATPLATPLSMPFSGLPAPQQNSSPAANASPYASEPAMPGTTMPRWTTPSTAPPVPAATIWPIASTTAAAGAPFNAPLVPPPPRKIADLSTLPMPQKLPLATTLPGHPTSPAASTAALELAPSPARPSAQVQRPAAPAGARPADSGSGMVQVQYPAPPKPATLPTATPAPAAAQPQATPLATPLSMPFSGLPAPQQNSSPAANASPYASEPAMPGTTMPRWTTPSTAPPVPAATIWPIASTTAAAGGPFNAPLVPPPPRKIADLSTLPMPQKLPLAMTLPGHPTSPAASTAALELAPSPARPSAQVQRPAAPAGARPADSGSGMVQVQYPAPPKPAILPPPQVVTLPQPRPVAAAPAKPATLPPATVVGAAPQGWHPTWSGSADNVPQASSVVHGLPQGTAGQPLAAGSSIVRTGYQTPAGTSEPVRQVSSVQPVQRPTPTPPLSPTAVRIVPVPVQTAAAPVQTLPAPQLVTPPAAVRIASVPVQTAAAPVWTLPAPQPMPSAPAQRSAVPQPGEAYVATGVMIVSEPER